MKKIFVTLLMTASVFSLVACGGKDTASTETVATAEETTAGGNNTAVAIMGEGYQSDEAVSDEDELTSACKNLSNAQEMSYIRTAKDEMGNKSPNCFTAEVDCTYKFTADETLIEGYVDDEQHIVYIKGDDAYILKEGTFVKDNAMNDALNNLANTAKTYAMTPSHFVACELEGDSEVDGIMCHKYHGTNGADSFFTDEYHFMEQTVYVRTDTNTVYYIEIVYTEDESSFSYCGLNPLIVKMKFFDETNIVVPEGVVLE